MAGGLTARLKGCGAVVTEVEFGETFQKTSDNRFVIRGTEEDYNKLIHDVSGQDITMIIHMSTVSGFDEICSLDRLEEGKKNSILSLYYLAKALMRNKARIPLDMVLISDYAMEVNQEEKMHKTVECCFPEYGKVVGAEIKTLLADALI